MASHSEHTQSATNTHTHTHMDVTLTANEFGYYLRMPSLPQSMDDSTFNGTSKYRHYMIT